MIEMEILLTSRARHKIDTMFHLGFSPIEGKQLIVRHLRGRHCRN